MNILLISDIHFGVKGNDVTFLNNSKEYILKDVCKVIEEQNCKFLIIAGDLFDNRISVDVLVKNTVIDLFNNILTRFEELKIIILCGNHDIYYKNTLEISSLNTFKKFHDRLKIISRIQKFKFDECDTILVPWIVEGSQNEKIFNSIIEKYKETNKPQFDLCIGHFDINGFEIVHGVKAEHGLEQESFKAFKTVFSGHFHIRNKIGNIQYLGCPYEITWNDYGDPKGVTVFNTENKTSTFYENKFSPKHIVVKISNLEKNIISDEEIKGNYIKFVIDENIDPSRKLELIKKVESLCGDFTSLDETTPTLDGEEIEISDQICISPLHALNDYVKNDQTKVPEDIDKDEMCLLLKEIYEKSVKEAKE